MSANGKPRRPNLFILGAPRCGTTAMFEFLGAHPEIHPCRVKEPYYFVPANRRTLEEYLDLFEGATDERWLLEATPHYLSMPDAPRLIRELSPEARAVIMLRDPVELMHSLHDLLTRLQREVYDFPTALERDEGEARYWRTARYGEQLERVFEAFPHDAVHVVVYDDFLADNAVEYRRLLQFLGVDPDFRPRFRKVNPSAESRVDAVQRALWREDSVLRTAARQLLPRSLRLATWRTVSRINRRPRPRSPLDNDVARSIWLRLEPDVELLSSLLDRDFVSLWGR